MNKISIIGTGSVGSTIAYTLTVMGLASEIVMIDINSEKALGEALDIRQGTPFCGACSIYAGDYRDAANSNIVIITSGIARKPGQTPFIFDSSLSRTITLPEVGVSSPPLR